MSTQPWSRLAGGDGRQVHPDRCGPSQPVVVPPLRALAQQTVRYSRTSTADPHLDLRECRPPHPFGTLLQPQSRRPANSPDDAKPCGPGYPNSSLQGMRDSGRGQPVRLRNSRDASGLMSQSGILGDAGVSVSRVSQPLSCNICLNNSFEPCYLQDKCRSPGDKGSRHFTSK